MLHINVFANATGQSSWSRFIKRLIQSLQASQLNRDWSISEGLFTEDEALIFLENKEISLAFSLTLTNPGGVSLAEVKLTAITAKRYTKAYLTKDGYAFELVSSLQAHVPRVPINTVDHALKMITKSIYACAIPLAKESVGSHENCNSCGHQLYCLARKED